MGDTNLEYTVSLDVARAMRDLNTLAAGLRLNLAHAANQAHEALRRLQNTRLPSAAELAGFRRAALPSPARAALPALVAAGAGAAAARLTAPGSISPIAHPASAASIPAASEAGKAAVVAAQKIAAEARAAFAPLRLALSHLRLPGPAAGGGTSPRAAGGVRPALTQGRGGVIDVESSVVSQGARSAGVFAQAWQRAVSSVRTFFADLRQRAREIVAHVDVGGAMRGLGGLLGRLTQVREGVKNVREESQKGGSILGTIGNAATQTLAPLAALAAGYLSVSFAFHQFHDAINQAADFEQLKVGFSVLLQSGAKAKAMLADLTNFADTTPLQMPELAQAARTLLAFGTPAQSVMKDLRQLGDIAAGVQAPIGEIAELFGKARTEGTLFSIDIRELTRRGIPVIGELAKQFHVSETAIHSMVEAGRVKFADLQTAIGNLTGQGGMFFGMLAAQGQTFTGKISTMEDAVNALYREFGTPVLEPLKGGITAISNILSGWKDKAREWGQTLANVLQGSLAIIQNGDAGKVFGAGLQLGVAEAVNTLYKGAMATVAALSTGLGNAANVIINALAAPTVGQLITDMLDVAGHSLVAIVQHGIADAIRNIYGLSKTAEKIDAAADRSEQSAGVALFNVQNDLQSADVQDVSNAVADGLTNTKDAFTSAYANTPNPVDEEKPKAALAVALQSANSANDPPPSYSGNNFNPSGSGSISAQIKAQTTGADLSQEWTKFYRGLQEANAPDPGIGTIGGRTAGEALGQPGAGNSPLRQSALFNATPRPSTLPVVRPGITIPDINSRAQALIGSGQARPDPRVDVMIGLLTRVAEGVHGLKRKPEIPGSGM